jgi:hypothetical protein
MPIWHIIFARFLGTGKIEQNACYEWFAEHYVGSKNRANKSYRFRQPSDDHEAEKRKIPFLKERNVS